MTTEFETPHSLEKFTVRFEFRASAQSGRFADRDDTDTDVAYTLNATS